MSAPDTNVQKQAEKHRGPLTGMLMAVVWAAVLLVGLLIYLSMRGGAPEGAATQVDGRTGGTGDAAGAEGAVTADDAGQAQGTATEDPAAVTVTPEATAGEDSAVGNVTATDPGASATAQPLEAPDAGAVDGDASAPEEGAAATAGDNTPTPETE